MVLLTSVSKIKKVWTVTFVPRLLRGDLRCTPISYAVQRKAHKSTSTTKDGEYYKNKNEHTLTYDYIFLGRQEPLLEPHRNKKEEEDTAENVLDITDQPGVSPPLLTKETHVEKCQRLIEKAFGKQKKKSGFDFYINSPNRETKNKETEVEKTNFDEERKVKEKQTGKCQTLIEKAFGRHNPLKHVLTEPYYYTDVNIEETRRKIEEAENSYKNDKVLDKPISTDNRIQFGVFKRNPELNSEDNLITSLESNDAGTSATENTEHLHVMQLNIGLNPKKENNGSDYVEPLLPEKLNLIRRDGNICAVAESSQNTTEAADSEDKQEVVYYDHMGDPIPAANEDINNYIKKQQQLQSKLFCDMQHMYESGHSNAGSKTALNVKGEPNNIYSENYWLKNKKDIEESYRNKFISNRLLATTAKETEEQLTQKIENIDETPLVEAHKPKIEGFNVTPKVLGDFEPTLNSCNDKKMDNLSNSVIDPNNYDEVAKRCLDTPTGKIDEILLKEMEKLGIPMSGRRDNNVSPSIEEDIVQMDVLSKQPKTPPSEKADVELEAHGYEIVAEKLLATETLFPATQPETKSNENSQPETQETRHSDRKFMIHPQQVLIDPYDKKSLAYDTEEYDASNCYDPILYDQKCVPTETTTKDTQQTSFVEKSKSPIDKTNDTIVNLTSDPTSNQSEKKEISNTYAKGVDSTAEAPTMTTKDTCVEEQSNPSEKDVHNVNANEVGKAPSFVPPKTYEQYIWYEQQFNPQSQYNCQVNTQTSVSGTTNTTQQGKSEEIQLNSDEKPQECNTNRNSTTSTNYCNVTWEKNLLQDAEGINRTNMNVSDAIWDDHLLDERLKNASKRLNQAEVESKFSSPQNNESYSASTGPQAQTCETKRVADNKTIIESEIRDPRTGDPEYQLGLTQTQERSYEERMNRVTTFLQSESIMENVKINTASITDTLNALPKLDESVSLSELLRRVRERSRIIECKNELRALGVEIHPVEGKCGKNPRCSPMTRPPPQSYPQPPQIFGLPPVKPTPPMCKPRKKPRSNKCSSCDIKSLGLNLGPKIADVPVSCPEMICEMNVAGAMEISIPRPRIDLTDDIIDRLQALGKILGVVLRQGKTEVLESAVVRNQQFTKIVLARDYQPWAPIPSWPAPKPPQHKQKPCTPGCKIWPPPRTHHDPPCEQRPCEGPPKKSFAVLDCFAVSLGKNKVYDLVHHAVSPVLCRSFSKTEWTKPKFDVTKPYSISRDNTDDQYKYDDYEEITRRPRKKKKKAAIKRAAAEFSFTTPMIPNSYHVKKCAPFNLNLDHLLISPTAPVSYVVCRNFSIDCDYTEKHEVFWRPKARIPFDPAEYRERMQNPKLRKEMEEESKYLLMTFDDKVQKPKRE